MPASSKASALKSYVLWMIPIFPYLFFIFIFLVVPIALTIRDSFRTGGIVNPDPGYTFVNYLNFFQVSRYYNTLIMTIIIGLTVSFICLAIALPWAYIVIRTKRLKEIFLAFVTIPRMVSIIVVCYSILAFLSPTTGFLTYLIKSVGLQAPRLLYNIQGIIIGFVFIEVPTAMVLLLGVVEGIDPDLIDASKSLGAGEIKTFFRIILPLSKPGLIASFVLLLGSTVSIFTIPLILGGIKIYNLSLYINSEIKMIGDWNMGFAIATILLLLTSTLTIYAYRYLRILK